MAGKFDIASGKSGKFRFNLKASNDFVILRSEQYNTKVAAKAGIASVKKNAVSEKRFELLKAKDGRAYFVLKATNGEIIGKSQMYFSKSGARRGVASVRRFAQEAAIIDLTK